MTVPRIVGERRWDSGYAAIDISGDMSNAFACCQHSVLDRLAAESLAPEDIELSEAGRSRMVLEIETPQGLVRGHVAEGVLMGDKSGPQEFCCCFHQPISRWYSHGRPADARPYVKCAFTQRQRDASLVLFADDLWKKLLVPIDSIAAAAELDIINSSHVFVDAIRTKLLIDNFQEFMYIF